MKLAKFEISYAFIDKLGRSDEMSQKKFPIAFISSFEVYFKQKKEILWLKDRTLSSLDNW